MAKKTTRVDKESFPLALNRSHHDSVVASSNTFLNEKRNEVLPPDSSNCFGITVVVIVEAFAKVDFSMRSLAARNLVFSLLVVGFTNLTSTISCS